MWQHESRQAGTIARRLSLSKGRDGGWARLFSPRVLLTRLQGARSRRLIHKNLLFTKKLAFQAVKDIRGGQDRATAFRFVEIETKNLLDREKRGLYTEKVRRKQLHEIELLMDHYLATLASQGSTYDDLVRVVYPSRKAFLTFQRRLQQVESEVMEASSSTLRHGSKRERAAWFQKLRKVHAEVHAQEVERLFPET